MKSNEIWTIVIVSLIVAVVASVATVSLTGNTITGNAITDTNFQIKNPAGSVLATLTSAIGDSVKLSKMNGKGDLTFEVNNIKDANNIVFRNKTSELMRISNNGFVGIGAVSPIYSSEKLRVSGGVRIDSGGVLTVRAISTLAEGPTREQSRLSATELSFYANTVYDSPAVVVGVNGIKMQTPDGTLVSCGPNNLKQWVCK